MRDVMAAMGELYQPSSYRGPPNVLGELAADVTSNRNRRVQVGARPN